jgi:hypothetical protein
LSDFKRYRSRPVTREMRLYVVGENLAHPYTPFETTDQLKPVSISAADIANGSPKLGDLIARNPDDHSDQWLVSADYAAKHFELIEE